MEESFYELGLEVVPNICTVILLAITQLFHHMSHCKNDRKTCSLKYWVVSVHFQRKEMSLEINQQFSAIGCNFCQYVLACGFSFHFFYGVFCRMKY